MPCRGSRHEETPTGETFRYSASKEPIVFVALDSNSSRYCFSSLKVMIIPAFLMAVICLESPIIQPSGRNKPWGSVLM